MPNFAVAICYEISDSLKIKDAVHNGGELILAIANLDPYPQKIHDQFISMASMRSIENNRDSIIASNTGPSGLIRSDGRIDSLIASNVEENIIVYPNLKSQNSFYTKFGIQIFSIIFILLIILNFLRAI